METLERYGNTVMRVFTNWDSRLAVIYLLATVLLVFCIWFARGRPTGFLRFLLPREVYFHRSNIVDIQIFLTNCLLGIFGVWGAVLFTPLVTLHMLTQFVVLSGSEFQPAEITWARSALATVVMVLAMDFCKYWAHYLHHENRFLWPFHALHHSADVLTPLTAHRNHPVFIMIRNVIYSLVLGTVQALALFLFIGEIDLLTIGSVNAGYFIFNMLGANLRHSHVWLSYGRKLEHILISPAQHQIHHSSAKKHFNKNYGEVFAFWDWMFGTLYIPDGYEKLDFGVADANGVKIEQPHRTLREALFKPFLESFQEASGIDLIERRKQKTSTALDTPAE